MKGEKQIRTVATRAETRKAGGKRFIDGMIPYNVQSEDLGGFVEKIAPTAFRRTLNARSEVFAFWAHDEKEILGSTRSGTLQLDNRPEGLRFSIQLPDSAASRFESIARGDVPGVSFSFIPEADSWDNATTPPTRTLTAVRLLEISPGVAFPAYPAASSSASQRSKESTDRELLELELSFELDHALHGPVEDLLQEGSYEL